MEQIDYKCSCFMKCGKCKIAQCLECQKDLQRRKYNEELVQYNYYKGRVEYYKEQTNRSLKRLKEIKSEINKNKVK